MSGHTGLSTGIADIGGIVDIAGALFGGSSTKRGTVTSETKATQREQLILDEVAIQKIIEDVLGGTQGLASIFAGEQTAGIFSSTVTAQAAGDLVANLVGELAKLTAVRETVQEATGTKTTEEKTKDKGLLGGIFG